MNKLRSLENKVLRKIFPPKGAVIIAGRNLIIKSFAILFHKCKDDQIEQEGWTRYHVACIRSSNSNTWKPVLI